MSQLKIPFSVKVVILSSAACSGGLLFLSHRLGWNKLNQQIRDYLEEYENLELIHCNGVRLAYGYLGVKPIFGNAKLIPLPLQLKICKLLGGQVSKTLLAAVVSDFTNLVGEIPKDGEKDVEKFKVNYLRSVVAKTPQEFKAYHGSDLRLLSVGFVVAVVGIGLWGFFCFNAGNPGILKSLSGIKSLPLWSLVRALKAEDGPSNYIHI